MDKKKTPIYVIGGLCVALVLVMTVLTMTVASGSFHLRKTKIVIRTGSDEKEYDGKPLRCDEWTMVSGRLSDEHELRVSVYGEQTRAGSSENYADVTVVDRGGLNVTDQYDIVIDAGKLEVTKKKITVESYSSFKLYDGYTFTHEYAKMTKGRITRGEHLEVTDFAEETDPGVYENTFIAKILDEEGNDVSDHYDITYVYGTLTIKCGTLQIVSGDASKEYDGTPLVCDNCKLVEGILQNGHRLEMKAIGSIRTVGQSANNISVTVYDKKGTEVTYLYDVVVNTGMLTITPRVLVVETSSLVREKGSKPVTDDWKLLDGKLVPGEELKVWTSQQYDSGDTSGSYENAVVRATIKTEGSSEDLSNCYQIIYRYGRYEIRNRE
ncbi:MAG: hypothetical protein J5795_03710 [Lachnospiraceae bacterium]|nr:hypothetical protein [Lachnospiraceae bacterium]